MAGRRPRRPSSSRLTPTAATPTRTWPRASRTT
jgi:hypothetical protein